MLDNYLNWNSQNMIFQRQWRQAILLRPQNLKNIHSASYLKRRRNESFSDMRGEKHSYLGLIFYRPNYIHWEKEIFGQRNYIYCYYYKENVNLRYFMWITDCLPCRGYLCSIKIMLNIPGFFKSENEIINE